MINDKYQKVLDYFTDETLSGETDLDKLEALIEELEEMQPIPEISPAEMMEAHFNIMAQLQEEDLGEFK